MLLTVGSPALAAYSLALTVLNEHWIAQRFSALSYPNVRNAVKALTGLQQSPLHVNADDSLLASLVVLHANDNYWETLEDLLNYVQTWSISAVASILWVIYAPFSYPAPCSVLITACTQHCLRVHGCRLIFG